MTLFKQMAIALSLLIIIILASVMVQNYQTAKKDMVENLYQMTVNNISSLSATIANNADKIVDDNSTTPPAMIISIVDSAFDSGYYKLINFQTDNYSYKQIDNDPIEGVPNWFIKFSNIEIKPIVTDVTDNWMSLGKLTVIGDVSVTYKALYKIFINLLTLFSVVSVISLILLSIMLHFILKPLKRVKHQAEGILNSEFIIEKDEPYTTEFKDVSKAMNSMVKKVQEIFQQSAQAMKRNKELQYNDHVTKLFNRRYLMLKLPELIKMEGKTDGGSILLLALDGAEYINKILGRQKADDLFLQLAKIFQTEAKIDDDAIVSRVNGTEFIIVLPNTQKGDANISAKNIIINFKILLQEHKISKLQAKLNIGIYRYKRDVSIADLLTRVDTALLRAKNSESLNIYIYEDANKEESLAKTQWRILLENSIKELSFRFYFTPVKNIDKNEIVHELISFDIVSNSKTYSYNSLIAPAITLGMTSELYLSVLTLLFSSYKDKLKDIKYSIRLPKEFLEDEMNFDKLMTIFDKNKKSIKNEVCFEISDSFAFNKTPTVLGYINLFKKYNFSIGIHSYSANASDFSYLKDIHPKYIKIDTQFLLDQSQDAINNLQVIAKSLAIDIIATNTVSDEELQMLKKYNICKFQETIADTI